MRLGAAIATRAAARDDRPFLTRYGIGSAATT
jgi:hypothetical protein